MKTTDAIIEALSDPLAGGFLMGWLLGAVGVLLQTPVLLGVGVLLVVLSLFGGLLLSLI